VLVDVNGRGRAADAVNDRGYDRDSGIARTANGYGNVPGAGAGVAVVGDGEWRGGVGITAHYNILNAEAEDGSAVGISPRRAKNLTGADGKRNGEAGVQRNGCDAFAAGVAAAFAQAPGESGDKANRQYKEKAGTATMHEPSSKCG